MPNNNQYTLSTSTLTKVLTLIIDIPTSKLINELKISNKISNHKKKEITAALRTLSELKKYHQKPIDKIYKPKITALINLFMMQVQQGSALKEYENHKLNDLINFINQNKKIEEILYNEYSSILKNYQKITTHFYIENIASVREFEIHLANIDENLNAELEHAANFKSLNEAINRMAPPDETDDDLDDDWENETEEKASQTIIKKQTTFIKNEITKFQAIKNVFRDNLIAFCNKARSLLDNLTKIENEIKENRLGTFNTIKLDKAIESKYAIVSDIKAKYPEIEDEVKAIKENNASPTITKINQSIKKGQDILDNIETRSLELNLYDNVSGELFEGIKKDILNSTEFLALKEFKPENKAKIQLIKYYLNDIADTQNLDELIRGTQANEYDPKLKISMRENTSIIEYAFNFLFYTSKNNTNELAKAIEIKLQRIINEQKKLIGDMHSISNIELKN